MAKYCLAALAICLLFLTLTACASKGVSRKGVISKELPLTLSDLVEIRKGEEFYQKVLEEYRLYHSSNLQTYLNTIAADIAAVSIRPHLPYRVVLLDSEEVNIFGGPGGYIYVTRGLLNFVEAEAEIAGLIAHEIGHISHHDYSHIPHVSKVKLVHAALLKGTELAKDSIGTYGTAAHYTVKYAGKAAPVIAKRFGEDAEVKADELAVQYLIDANYDPRGLQNFMDRLSRVEIGDVGRFVVFMDTHPPFQARRDVLDKRLTDKDFDIGRIHFKRDTLSEIRQVTVNSSQSILFVPQLGVTPFFSDDFQNKENFPSDSPRRRGSWF